MVHAGVVICAQAMRMQAAVARVHLARQQTQNPA
jgi:hypothetical protein